MGQLIYNAYKPEKKPAYHTPKTFKLAQIRICGNGDPRIRPVISRFPYVGIGQIGNLLIRDACTIQIRVLNPAI